MKYLNKLAAGLCVATMGLMMMTGCDSKDLYQIDSPNWISDSINAVKERNAPKVEVLENQMDDVYTTGNSDFSSGFWSAFSKYYVIPEGGKWEAMINLHINPKEDTKYFQNFAVVYTNDVDRGGDGYQEYGVIRYDNDPSKNSEWGDLIDRSLISSNLTMSSGADDIDANVQKLAGKVAIIVDRTEGGLKVRYNNGTVVKTYNQETPLENIDPKGSTNIRCFIVADGSYFDFVSTNIEPIGGVTPKEDQQPEAITGVQGVPKTLNVGDDLKDAMKNVTAKVKFFNVPQPVDVTAKDLEFKLIPEGVNIPGEKTLVILYNKTFKGENATSPAMAYQQLIVGSTITKLEVTKQPTRTAYTIYASEAVESLHGGYPIDPAGMEVTATYSDGSKIVVDNNTLKISGLKAVTGNQNVTISSGSVSTQLTVSVTATPVTVVHPTPTTLGPTDNSGAWWTFFSEDMKVPAGQTYQVDFTNYSPMTDTWNNWNIVLRNAAKTEFGVVRADNYGWLYATQPIPGTRYSGRQADEKKWLSAMNGAKCTIYITNCGDGLCDVQAVMRGTDGNTYYQYYLNTPVDSSDLWFSFIIDHSHLVFN